MTDQTLKVNLAQLMLRAFYWTDESLQRNIRRLGGPEITHSQSMLIITIGEGINRPSAIAERLGVSRQAIHQSLRELVSAGLVELLPDPDDGRAKIAILSVRGEPLRILARHILDALEAELGGRIGNRRLKSLRAALECNWGEAVEIELD